MIVPLLAGCAKTIVVSMLSERVVLRVLLMLAEWASAKSSTSLDDKIVTEIRTKLEADGKLYCGRLLVTRRTFLLAAGVFMAKMNTPNFSRSEMACRCGCGHDKMDQEFLRMLQALMDEIGPMPVTSGFRCDAHNNCHYR